jgi:hypothetical protein
MFITCILGLWLLKNKEDINKLKKITRMNLILI